jgi:crotonobetainyl-CoA:carnitine CoA-transferase CaiB-like acyl-CoA transferase
LSGIVVAERGGRLAAAVAGTLLGALGATVWRLEDDRGRPLSDPLEWHAHPLSLEGKLRFTAAGTTKAPDPLAQVAKFEPAAVRDADATWNAMCADADVALVSDRGALPANTPPVTALFSAFGADARDGAASELAVQARSGAMATTGRTGGAPCTVRAPLLELLAGINAASSVMAALRAGTNGILDLALLDSALALAGTFHAQALADHARRFRNGATHPLCSPWNVYRATDGWVAICVASDDQWRRFADVIGRADLAANAALSTSTQRVAAVQEVDAAVTSWTQARTVAEVTCTLGGAELPVSRVAAAGPAAASSLRECAVPSGASVRVPPALAWFSHAPMQQAGRIEATQPFAQRASAARRAEGRATHRRPLHELKVIELGPFTAGPLTGRYLADLGAEVIKVEPPGGEVSRKWQPRVAHASHYFANYNCGKRSVELDLGNAADAAALRDLVRDADVVVQNMRPGVLRKFGVDLEELAKANPRLIVCNISGYGRDAPPAPALDTVVQAGSGLMALVWSQGDGGPVKTGFSYGDLTAAHVATFAILAAITQRDKSGEGQVVDVAMQDALVWLTQLGWPEVPSPRHRVEMRDGQWTLRVDGEVDEPVLEIADAVDGADARRRHTLRHVGAAPDAGSWQVLASPIRWRSAPADNGDFVAATGEDNARTHAPATS